MLQDKVGIPIKEIHKGKTLLFWKKMQNIYWIIIMNTINTCLYIFTKKSKMDTEVRVYSWNTHLPYIKNTRINHVNNQHASMHQYWNKLIFLMSRTHVEQT